MILTLYALVIAFMVLCAEVQSQVLFKIRRKRMVYGRGVNCVGNGCFDSANFSIRDFNKIYCIGGVLTRSPCVPVCQESCYRQKIIKDAGCQSDKCRVGCTCPRDRPLRKGLSCIRREECEPSTGTVPSYPQQQCPPGLKFTPCTPACQRTCDNYNEAFTAALCRPITCVGGCICSRDSDVLHEGACVPPERCMRARVGHGFDEIKCGTQFYKPNVRIVGGEYALQGSWPWTVQILKGLYAGTQKLTCSGTVICSKWIVTAAHCFENSNGYGFNLNPAHYKVMIGKHLKSSKKSELYAQEKQLRRIIPHPSYDFRTKLHDIALIEVHGDIVLSAYVRRACVPPHYPPYKPYTSWGPQLGTQCYVAGWGETAGRGPSNAKLKQAKLSVRMSSACSRMFADFRGETMLCIGGRKRNDACAGDSGGALMCKHQPGGQWYVDGVISYGISCGVVGEPAVYTRVTAYSKWLADTSGPTCASSIEHRQAPSL